MVYLSKQVTHHSLIPIYGWTMVRFAPGGESTFGGFMNYFVHSIMYTYYFLGNIYTYFKYIVLCSLNFYSFFSFNWSSHEKVPLVEEILNNPSNCSVRIRICQVFHCCLWHRSMWISLAMFAFSCYFIYDYVDSVWSFLLCVLC